MHIWGICSSFLFNRPEGNGTGSKVSKLMEYSNLQWSSPLWELTCHTGSHSVTCHLAEKTFPPLTYQTKAGTQYSDLQRYARLKWRNIRNFNEKKSSVNEIAQHGWWFSAVVASFVVRTKLLNVEPVSTGMGDRLLGGIPPRYVTKPTRSTQPCIPLGSLNRVPALIGWGKGGNLTSAGWQVTLCDPIWHVSSRSGVVLVAQTAIRFL